MLADIWLYTQGNGNKGILISNLEQLNKLVVAAKREKRMASSLPSEFATDTKKNASINVSYINVRTSVYYMYVHICIHYVHKHIYVCAYIIDRYTCIDS